MKKQIVSAIAAAMFVLAAVSAFAQETTVRFYIVPKAGDGTHGNAYRAKYIADDPAVYAGGTGAIAGVAEAKDYGFENIMIVGADVTPAEDASISAQPDVIAIPQGLDNTITSINLTALKNALENLKIPAGWVTTSHTYREVGRMVIQLFGFFQRCDAIAAANGLSRTPFSGNITLDSTIGQLPAAWRNVLTQAAQDFNLSTAGITNGTTLRAALRTIAAQLPNPTVRGVTF